MAKVIVLAWMAEEGIERNPLRVGLDGWREFLPKFVPRACLFSRDLSEINRAQVFMRQERMFGSPLVLEDGPDVLARARKMIEK